MNDRYALPLSPHRAERVRRALWATLEALRLARREALEMDKDPARQGWVALGLVTALQAALVAALSGYDTASLEAVQNPSQPERIAPGSLLLRRATSDAYLNPPERVDLTGSQERAVDRIVDVRNAAVHALAVEVPDSFRRDARVVVRLVSHLVRDAPAFDPKAFGYVPALIGDELAALSKTLHDGAGD
ncbi:MAG: hypothetical protein IPK75_03570 [Acidobacteria bacterium]|jgi:hypothetical protein|nr:hypothetical protein [Acidobacteriota bacterium]